jgi:two-component system cell cycle sensor histidine kinase/response regulator CckA
VQQAGGWIEVDSAPGEGARFSIYLPALPEPSGAGDEDGNPPSTQVAVISGTILFVEDDESIRALGARALRQHGFTVLPARHGVEALQLAGDRELHIDLLITDIVMPGLSGHELAKQLQQARPDLKMLYTSGYTDDAIALRDILVTGPAFIQKPYSLESLASKVRAVLSGS